MPPLRKVLALSVFALLCGCNKNPKELSDQNDNGKTVSERSSVASDQEAALEVKKTEALKTVKVTEPVSTPNQPSSEEPAVTEEAPESDSTARPVSLQTPATRSAARVAAMQEFKALKAARPDKPKTKGQ